MKPVVLLTALMLCTTSFAAQIYRWVDADGHVHYSETPPRDQEYKTLRTGSGSALVSDNSIRADDGSSDDEAAGNDATATPSAPPAAAPQNAVDANREFLKKAEAENKAAAEAKAKQEKEKAERGVICTKARERVAYLDATIPRRLAKVDAEGEVSRYSEEDYDQQRAEAQKAVSDNCR